MENGQQFDGAARQRAEIEIYGVEGTRQYIVATMGAEYSFTSEQDARHFARELASKRDVFKTASFDRLDSPTQPAQVEASKKVRRFPGLKF
jgi:hypothetical protein